MALLERDDALATLRRALDAVRASGQLVSIAGEAGIGKSSLLRTFAAEAGGARVVWGYCEALFTPRPLGPLLDMAPLLDGRSHDALAASRTPHDVFTAFVADLSPPAAPVVAIFEDVHWADEATLDLLQFVGRRIAATRAVVVVSWRDDEVPADHPLHRVLADWAGQSHRLRLAPLSIDAVARLTPPGRDAAAVHALTGGNPFFVTELADGSATAVPATVRDAVLARRARLDPTARAVLDLVSVVPARAELDLIDAALGTTAGLDACLAVGLLQGQPQAVAFRHELARLAVADALSASAIRDHHRLLVQALAARPDRSRVLARLVHHADAGADDAAVLAYAPEAARQAAALGAHRQAVDHYRRALRLAAALPPDGRAHLHEALAYEHYLTGDIDGARVARRAALDVWRREGRLTDAGRNIRWLSRLGWFAGDGAEAERLAVEAIVTLEPLGDGAELAMAYSNRAQLAMLADDRAACLAWGEKAIVLARRLDAVDVLSHALNNVGTALLLSDDAAGRAPLEESLRLALGHDLHEHVARAYTNLASAAVESHDYADARRWLDDGIAYCVSRDLDSWTMYMSAWRARLFLETGAWTQALADADTVVASSRAAAVSRIPALAVLGTVRVRRGEAGADVVLADALVLARRTSEFQRLAPVLNALAELHWMAGRRDAVVAAVDEGLARLPAGMRGFQRDALRYWRSKATATATPEAGSVSGADTPWAQMLRGDWQAAAVAWQRIGAPYERALALLDGDLEAVQLAFDLFHGLGAVPAADWARQRLRQLGLVQVPRGRRASTLKHPAGLTAREAEILSLLAQGLTNPQIASRLFVAPKTVEHHVTAILGKLAAPTREAAVVTARAQGWLGERRQRAADT